MAATGTDAGIGWLVMEVIAQAIDCNVMEMMIMCHLVRKPL